MIRFYKRRNMPLNNLQGGYVSLEAAPLAILRVLPGVAGFLLSGSILNRLNSPSLALLATVDRTC